MCSKQIAKIVFPRVSTYLTVKKIITTYDNDDTCVVSNDVSLSKRKRNQFQSILLGMCSFGAEKLKVIVRIAIFFFLERVI